jgi:DNA modification methylase
MTAPYLTDEASGTAWRLILGDSCEELPKLPAETVDLSIHSPPFDSLYTYSDSPRDLGNSATREEFLTHYSFIIRELWRLTRPGRVACVHAMDLSTTKTAHGVIGLTDFTGDIVRAYQQAGWTYVDRVTVRKNPQAAAQRTKAQGLAFGQLRRDRAMTRPVHPDYLLTFRKPGVNTVPINSPIDSDEVAACFYCKRPGYRHRWAGVVDGVTFYACSPNCHEAQPLGGDVDNNTWIRWAEAIWDDIPETDTLNVAVAREDKDERHLCALQLPLIERCIRLWSNPGETVLSPCAGIGSEVYQAVQLGRRGVGVELKPSYWRTAVTNLTGLQARRDAGALFEVTS